MFRLLLKIPQAHSAELESRPPPAQSLQPRAERNMTSTQVSITRQLREMEGFFTPAATLKLVESIPTLPRRHLLPMAKRSMDQLAC